MTNLGNTRITLLANAWHLEAKQCCTRPGQARSSLETDSGYKNKNIGSYPKSLRPFLRILCVVDDYTYRRIFFALRKDAFGALARHHCNLYLSSIFAHI